jgi:hypothetical protein
MIRAVQFAIAATRPSPAMTIYRRSRVSFTPETLEEIRRRYEETDESQISIATSVGIERSTLTRLVRTKGWVLRKDRPPYDLPQAFTLEAQATEAVANLIDDAPGDGSDSAAAAGPIADRLEAALERELRKVESQRAARGNATQRTIDDERLARTLAMLTETLIKVRRLRHPGNVQATNDDDLPADADEFRIKLALRIEAFVRSRADASVSGGSEPADGDAAAP